MLFFFPSYLSKKRNLLTFWASMFALIFRLSSPSRSGSWRVTKTVSLQAPCSRPRALLAVLRDTVAKRPIFFLDFDQTFEDIFRERS